MPEQPTQDKTEEPTPKRRSETLDEGRVAKSTELNSVAVLFGALIAFKLVSGNFSETLNNFVKYIYFKSSFIDITPDSILVQSEMVFKVVLILLLPVLIAVLIAGMGSNFAQVGFVFAKKALNPKFNKINPLSGIKRLISLRSIVELIKGILKIIIVALVAYFVINKYENDYMYLATKSVGEIVSFAVDIVFELGVKVGLTLLLIAAADYAYQRWEHEKSLKMTKQEIRDEMKQHEGNPQIKSRIKSVQREMSSKRMFAAVPEATVVVTNPVHLAIALKYEPEKNSDAPKVVAKGKRKIAEKIKEMAIKYKIPIIEDKPLARSLYDTCEIGMEIPIEFYQAIAGILAQIYKMDKKSYSKISDNINVN